MKIALLSPPLNPIVDEMKYGGIERIVISLAEGCKRAGHEVTVFAPSGSSYQGLEFRYYHSVGRDVEQAESSLFQAIVEDQMKYDVIHSFVEPVIAHRPEGNRFEAFKKSIVVTFENSTYINENLEYYRQHIELWRHHFVFISKDQAKPMDFLPNRHMIYNGVKLSELSYSEAGGDKLAFLGRITPEKGIEEAIMLAKRLRIRLEIGARIDNSNLDFFKRRIKPHLDGKEIVYLGELNAEERNRLLGTSMATLCLVNWHEPFGLVAVESLAAGTPVVARSLGALPEIIEDKKSGLILPNDCTIEECAQIFEKEAGSISRSQCLARSNYFSDDRMVDQYLELYKML